MQDLRRCRAQASCPTWSCCRAKPGSLNRPRLMGPTYTIAAFIYAALTAPPQVHSATVVHETVSFDCEFCLPPPHQRPPTDLRHAACCRWLALSPGPGRQ